MTEAVEVFWTSLNILGGVALATIFTILLSYAAHRYAVSVHLRGLIQLGDRLGAKIIETKGMLWNPMPHLEATYSDRPLLVKLATVKGRSAMVNLEIPLASPLDLRLEILRNDIRTRMFYLAPGNILKTGDAGFDSAFRVVTNNKGVALQLMEPFFRRQLMYHAENHRYFSLQCDGRTVTFRSESDLFSEEYRNSLFRMLSIAVWFANKLEGKTILPRSIFTVSSAFDEEAGYPDGDDYLKNLLKYDLWGGKWEEGKGVVVYSISHKKRPLVLKYRTGSVTASLEIAYQVIQKFWLRMLPQSGPDHESELVTGQPELDLNYRIHSDHPEVALPFLQSPAVSDAVRQLGGLNRFEIHRGWVKLTILNPGARGFYRSHFLKALENLLIIVEAYQEQRLLTVVQARAATAATLCPYCREELGSADIVACSLCRTPHHRSCWSENSQCTTWGCSAITGS